MPEVRGYIEQLIAARAPAPDRRRVSGAGADRRRRGAAQGCRARQPAWRWRGSGGRRRIARLKPRRGVEAESWQDVDRDLFERLRALRLEIARARGVPPYVIFHDTTLRDMARLKPTTIDALRHVYGVGERKAADLGRKNVCLAEIQGVELQLDDDTTRARG